VYKNIERVMIKNNNDNNHSQSRSKIERTIAKDIMSCTSCVDDSCYHYVEYIL
jgi:hypothetical protein